MRYIVISILASVAFTLTYAQKSTPYRWKSVQMVGGGFVDGIVCHPTAKGVRYARTDIGGAYRWDERERRWAPLMDWVSFADLNLMGVESIALDPSDPNRVYLACGTYTNATTPDGAILRSADRGKTFQITRMPFKFGGNENGRGNGERMMVDPNDGRILLVGTRHDGLWSSMDRGASWSPVRSFPWTPSDASAGVISVAFDPRSARKDQPTPTVYVAFSTAGAPSIFRTRDGGATWSAVPGQPTVWMPTHMVLASDGTLYITYGSSPGPSSMSGGAVWKLDTGRDVWQDVTPEKSDVARRFGYAAVSVQSTDPKALIVSSFYRPGGEEIFRSSDAGGSWKPIFHGGGGKYDFSIAPYVEHTPIHWLFDVEIDPGDPNHALFTTGYGGYETFDLEDADRGRPTTWSVMSRGIEETVSLQLLSPPSGAHLITAIGDYGGFVHWDLDRSPVEGNFNHPHFGNTTSLACASARPQVIVRVGQASGSVGGGNIGYSLDSGRSWRTTASTPDQEKPGRTHRGLRRWRDLDMDAPKRGLLHPRSGSRLDGLRRPAGSSRLGAGRSDRLQAVLLPRPLRRAIVRE